MPHFTGFDKRRSWPHFFLVQLVGFVLFLVSSTWCPGSGPAMRGPDSKTIRPDEANAGIETSSVRLAFAGLIRLYQLTASPVGGQRCGFSPSCSAFALEAIREQGPALGVVMAADRLMRDHIALRFTGAYTFLPNGKFYDPVSQNLLICNDR